MRGRMHFWPAGGTLLGLLRYGTGAEDVDGVRDVVDKDIDLLVAVSPLHFRRR